MSKVGINKDFVDRREEDNYMIKLREQESEKIRKKKRRRSVLWQDEGERGNNDARVFEA